MSKQLTNQKGILFILPRLYPCDSGGVELFHHYFVQSISSYYNVFICTICKEVQSNENIVVINYKADIFQSKTLSNVFNSYHAIYTHKNLIDIIHIPYSSKSIRQNIHLLLASKVLGIPYILRIHGGGMHPGKPHFLHQAMFDNAAGILAVSTPIKDEYERRHGRPISVIPSMLPFNAPTKSKSELRREYQIRADDQVVLFLGSIKAIKGPEILINAFFALGIDYIKAHRLKLFFVGDGELKDKLESSCESSGFRKFIQFWGSVPHGKVCDIYKLSDIFVIPSLMEARPLSLSEALFHGIPPIGSDISTVKNLIRHYENGLLFENQNSADLAEKLKMLIEDRNLREKISSKASGLYKESYVFDKMIQKYRTFYDGIIKGYSNTSYNVGAEPLL